MQAEIVRLFEELQLYVSHDRTAQDPGRRDLECNFSTLEYTVLGQESSAQYQKLLELRSKLRDYNNALLTFKQVSALPKAEKNTLENLRTWLLKLDGGNNFLHSFEATTWHPDTEDDLITLTGRRADSDIVSRLVDERLIPWLDGKLFSRAKKNIDVFDSYAHKVEQEPIHYYSDTGVSAVLGIIATTLAFALTTLPIFALYRVASPMGRTGIVIAFTFVFSVTVSVMTKARRIEYFAATVGFCAVLAAIIGNDDSIGERC